MKPDLTVVLQHRGPGTPEFWAPSTQPRAPGTAPLAPVLAVGCLSVAPSKPGPCLLPTTSFSN